ncbi:MAG: FAD-dependent thymidylate synthase [Lachnospiraceae bacterium]|nr:FAD-dependent thymidylate synthase [Lachnospiraceae bacterium]
MRIIEPRVEIIDPINADEIYRKLELCGRVCYKSESRITEESAEKFLKGIIKSGHESVLEHVSITARFICDRGVSHEIVRHRLASYSMESQRYCNYGKDREVTFIKPCFNPKTLPYNEWKNACFVSEDEYFILLAMGHKPEEARAVLNNSVKTELIMTANIREWRHFFRLRCAKSAHPQMRQVAMMLLEQMYEKLPVLFEDVWSEVVGDEK